MTMLGPIVRVTTPSGPRDLAEEVPVALVYNGGTHAVMMATPADIVDLAIGFTLTEGIASLAQAGEVEVVAHDLGLEARLWLLADREGALAARRRALVGAVGCGLCGIDSLEAAARSLPRLPNGGPVLTEAQAEGALQALRAQQPLHDATRSVHAAAFWAGGIVMAREDVGRHNALDKLVGGLARAGIDPATGVVIVTSRLSVEMVQKTVTAGACILLSVSAPTAHAVRLATAAGLTLASTAGGTLIAYTCPERITR